MLHDAFKRAFAVIAVSFVLAVLAVGQARGVSAWSEFTPFTPGSMTLPDLAYDESTRLWTVARRDRAGAGSFRLRFAWTSNSPLDDLSNWSSSSYFIDANPNHNGAIGQDVSAPRIAADGNGNWVVVWQQEIPFNSSSANTILAAVNTSAGITGGAANNWVVKELVSGGNPAANSSMPRIAYSDGTWVVVWGYLDNSNKGKVVYVYTTDLTTWSQPITIAADPALDTGLLSPEVAADGETWMITWVSQSGGVHYRTATDVSSEPQWSPRRTFDATAGTRPVVTTANGHWLVAWESGNDLRYVDASTAQLISGETPAPTTLAPASGAVRHIAAATDGTLWMLMCHLADVSMNGIGIFTTARIGGSGDFPPFSAVTETPTGERFPNVSTDGAGAWLTAFEDDTLETIIHLATGSHSVSPTDTPTATATETAMAAPTVTPTITPAIPTVTPTDTPESAPCLGAPDGEPCDDGILCNGIDTCDGAGQCVHAGQSCDDDDPCTADSCSVLADQCVHTVNVEGPCCGTCGNGTDDDGDGDIDAEDPQCSSLARLQRFGVISQSLKAPLYLGGASEVNATVGQLAYSPLPYPIGKSKAGVCGRDMKILAGSKMGFLTVKQTRRGITFGQGNTGAHDISIREGFASDDALETLKTRAPFVGPGVCSNDSLMPCAEPQSPCDDSAAEACCPGAGATCDDRMRLSDPANAYVDRSGTAPDFLRCSDALGAMDLEAAQLDGVAVNVMSPTDYSDCDVIVRTSRAVPLARIPATGALPSGVQVICLKKVKLAVDSKLEIHGAADTVLVIQVEKGIVLGGNTEVILADGILPQNVVWHVRGDLSRPVDQGRGGAVAIKSGAHLRGTVLAPRSKVKLGGASKITGAVYASRVFMNRASKIEHVPFLSLAEPMTCP